LVLLRQFTQTGDAEAFSEITRRYAGLVYATCLRVTGDAECARDATQDTRDLSPTSDLLDAEGLAATSLDHSSLRRHYLVASGS
jgi:hypothetical protein